MCPEQPAAFGDDPAVHRGGAVPRCAPSSHHAGSSPGETVLPRGGGDDSLTFSHLLLAPSLASAGHRRLLGDAGAERQCKHTPVSLGWPGPGLAGRKSPPGFLFPCKNFTPHHILGSRPLLSHGEAAVCFPTEYEARGTLSGSLVPGG